MNPADAFLQPDLTQSVWPPAGLEASTFYPDGLHEEWLHAPCYVAAPNFPVAMADHSNHASGGYWFKASEPGANFGQIHFNVCRSLGVPQITQTQSLFVAGGGAGLASGEMLVADKVVIQPNSGAGDRSAWLSPDFPLGQTKVRMPGLRWRLATFRFDTNETASGSCTWVGVKGYPFNPPPGQDLRDFQSAPFPSPEDILQGSLLTLGEVPFPAGFRTLANQVVDEVAIVDFGDAVATLGGAAQATDAWATDRYQDGRYYKGEGRFLSAVLQPWQGSGRLLKAWWTAYLPSESRQNLGVDVLQNPAKPVSGVPRVVDPALDGRCRVEVDLLAASGTQHTAQGDPAYLNALGQGAAVGRTLPSFRYRVRIRTDLVDPLTEPVLESPIFDDITFAWQRTSGPAILSWN